MGCTALNCTTTRSDSTFDLYNQTVFALQQLAISDNVTDGAYIVTYTQHLYNSTRNITVSNVVHYDVINFTSSVAVFQVPAISSGSYTVAFPDVNPNATYALRVLPSVVDDFVSSGNSTLIAVTLAAISSSNDDSTIQYIDGSSDVVQIHTYNLNGTSVGNMRITLSASQIDYSFTYNSTAYQIQLSSPFATNPQHRSRMLGDPFTAAANLWCAQCEAAYQVRASLCDFALAGGAVAGFAGWNVVQSISGFCAGVATGYGITAPLAGYLGGACGFGATASLKYLYDQCNTEPPNDLDCQLYCNSPQCYTNYASVRSCPTSTGCCNAYSGDPTKPAGVACTCTTPSYTYLRCAAVVLGQSAASACEQAVLHDQETNPYSFFGDVCSPVATCCCP